MLINITLFTIGLTSVFVNIWHVVRAFQKDEYNPGIFRLRQGYEYKPMMLIAYFGTVIPGFFMNSKIYKGAYAICILGIICTFVNVLNMKCFIKTRRNRIIIETLALDFCIIVLLIFIFRKMM